MRYSVSCFNVDTSAMNITFRKNGGEHAIKFMKAAFHKEAQFGEFFIEFQEVVCLPKVAEGFYALGAGQLTIDTFGNDGGEGAASCLVRINLLQKRQATFIPVEPAPKLCWTKCR